MITIGQVAKLAGVNKETIRYYEREGLIEKPPRQKSGYRQYPKATVGRILFIKGAQELNFSLKETKELLNLYDDPQAKCDAIKDLVQEKIQTLQERIQDLQTIQTTLSGLANECSAEMPLDNCPVIHYLNQREVKEEASLT